MPRRKGPPKLVWDEVDGYTYPQWFIRWYEGKRQRNRACGTDRVEADRLYTTHLAATRALPDEARTPRELLVADLLTLYGEGHVAGVTDAARIGFDIKALLPLWHGKTVHEIGEKSCRAHYRARRQALAAKFPKRAEASAPAADGEGPACFDGTIRRELSTLAAAIAWCVAEKKLTSAVPTWLPPKPPRRDVWLDRREVAALIRKARSRTFLWNGQQVESRSPEIEERRRNLPLFILSGYYTAARSEAMLSLQWLPNFQGGHVDLERGIVDFNPVARVQTSKRRARQKIHRRLLRFLRYARARNKQYVFERAVGDERAPIASVKRSFRTAVAAAGLKPGVKIHTLGHSSITWMMQRGVPVDDIASFVNKSPDVIWRVYGHHHPDHQQRALNAFG